MKRAGLLAILLGFALCIPGCGFTEGTDAVITVVRATPTPIPTPTPLPTPTPIPATPTPAPVIEQTPSGINVEVKAGVYTANTDVNIREDASPDGALIQGVFAGTELIGTGVCENGWIRVEYNEKTGYVSGDYVSLVTPPEETAGGEASGEVQAEGTAEAAAPAEGTVEAAAPAEGTVEAAGGEAAAESVPEEQSQQEATGA